MIGLGCRAPGGVRRRRQLLATCWRTGATPSARCRPTAGIMRRSTIPIRRRPDGSPRATAASSNGSTSSTPSSSASRRARRRAWTRSSACCSRCAGRRSRTPARRPIGWSAAPPASSSALPAATMPTAAASRRRSAARRALRLRHGAQRRCPGRVSYLLGLQGPSAHHRHGLLVVARRGALGLPGPARRASAGWRWPAAST